MGENQEQRLHARNATRLLLANLFVVTNHSRQLPLASGIHQIDVDAPHQPFPFSNLNPIPFRGSSVPRKMTLSAPELTARWKRQTNTFCFLTLMEPNSGAIFICQAMMELPLLLQPPNPRNGVPPPPLSPSHLHPRRLNNSWMYPCDEHML